jgi:uncharacterized protein
VEFLASNWSRLVIPSLAVTEVCHLLADPERRGCVGLAAECCAAIADDELRVIEITPHDYRRMAELLTTYSSLRLQAAARLVLPDPGAPETYTGLRESLMDTVSGFRCEWPAAV